MIKYKIIYTTGEFKTNNFTKLCKCLESNFDMVRRIEVSMDNLATPFYSIDKQIFDDMPLSTVEKEVLEASLDSMTDNKVDVFVKDLYIGKSKNIMEAVFDIYGNILNTEEIEWPMEMSMYETYVFCAFRYLTGIKTIIENPEL